MEPPTNAGTSKSPTSVLRDSLSEAEARFQQLAENIQQGFWVCDASVEKMTYISPAYEKIWGRPCDSLYHSLYEFSEMIHADDRKIVKEARQKQRAGLPSVVEYRIQRLDGSTRWIMERTFSIRDRLGSVMHIAGVTEDITERRQLQMDQDVLIRASDILAASFDYELMMNNLAHALVPAVADWCAIDVIEDGDQLKRVAIAHFDEKKERWAVKFNQLYPPNPASANGIHGVIRSGQPKLVSEQIDTLFTEVAVDDAHLRMLKEFNVCSIMMVPLRARANVIGVITFANSESGRVFQRRDLDFAKEIARRAALAADNARLYQDAQKANQMKDEFLATLSHELRTPLNPIIGWSDLLVRHELPEREIDAAHESIFRNAKLQEQLVVDLLDISKIVSGKFRFDPESVELNQLVLQAIASHRPAADAKSIRVNLDLGNAVVNVSGDPNRLQQVIWNLLSNAIKFTPIDGVVNVAMHVSGNREVEIEVSDNGEGVAEDFLPFIFERFRQEDSSITRRHGGLGLGLAISKHLAELHGGSLYVHSDGKNKGATFWLRLPVKSMSENKFFEPQQTQGLRAGADLAAHQAALHS